MKNTYKKLCFAVIATSTIFSAGYTIAAEFKMVISNDNNNLGLKGRTFEYFSEEVKNRLGDRVDIELHHSGTLFDQNSQVQGLQLGAVQLIAPTTGIYSSVSDKVNSFDLPFLLNSPEKILKAMNDKVVRYAFVPELQAKNIEPVAFWMNGPRDLGYRGKKSVYTPDDIKGMKVRVQSAPVYVKTFEAVGANPVGINWSESPTALQQGVIDGAEVTPNSWKASGTYKMIDQITLSEHQYSFYIVGANKLWWDGLPTDVRSALTRALESTTIWNVNNARKVNSEDMKFIEEAGVKVNRLTPEQRKLWVDAMQPVWKELGDNLVGEEVMTRLKQISTEN